MSDHALLDHLRPRTDAMLAELDDVEELLREGVRLTGHHGERMSTEAWL